MMLSTFYFFLFVVSIFFVSIYVIMASTEIVEPEYNSADESKLKVPNSATYINSFSVSNPNQNEMQSSNSEKDDFKPVDVNLEIKNKSRQLKRDLRTLNYITLLEARPKMIKDSERLEEISNLKEGLQRQIIKNTNLLNNYRQAQ